MKYLKASNPGERDRYYDKAALAQLDREQGRVRINAAEHQSMLYLITGRWLIEEALTGLKPFMRAAGAYRMIAPGANAAAARQRCWKSRSLMVLRRDLTAL